MSVQRQLRLAEDDENDVWFLQRAFQEAGVDNPLQVARNGQEAISYLAGEGDFADRGRFPLPYLLILDLKMPLKTGLDVLAWLRGQDGLFVSARDRVFFLRASPRRRASVSFGS